MIPKPTQLRNNNMRAYTLVHNKVVPGATWRGNKVEWNKASISIANGYVKLENKAPVEEVKDHNCIVVAAKPTVIKGGTPLDTQGNKILWLCNIKKS